MCLRASWCLRPLSGLGHGERVSSRSVPYPSSLPLTLQGLQAALDQTFDQVTVRVYGGHIFAVNGNINFINCLIYDLTILYPLTNFVIIGGDVLNLAGTVNFIGCTWFETTLLGVENGLGLVSERPD